MPSTASVTTWNATSSRLWRLTIAAPARRAQRVVDDVLDLVHEARSREPLGVRADARGCPRSVAAARVSAVGERLDRRVAEQHAGLAVDHRLERAAAAERDHRPAAGLRLDRHDAEVLFAGQDGRRSRAIQVAHLFVGAPAEELEPSPASALEARALGPVADDRQRRRRPGARPSSRGRRACRARGPTPPETRAVAGPARPARACRTSVSTGGYTRVDSTIIVQRDPPRNILRDSEIAVYAACRGAVPPGQRGQHRPQQRAADASRPAPARSRRRTGPRRSASA